MTPDLINHKKISLFKKN